MAAGLRHRLRSFCSDHRGCRDGRDFSACKKFADRADRIEGTFERMDAEYGEPSDFVPRTGRQHPCGRMEVFLAVRDEMGPTQQEVSDLFRTLDGENDAGVIAKVKAGMKFIPSLFDLHRRSQQHHAGKRHGRGGVPVHLFPGLLRASGKGSFRWPGVLGHRGR